MRGIREEENEDALRPHRGRAALTFALAAAALLVGCRSGDAPKAGAEPSATSEAPRKKTLVELLDAPAGQDVAGYVSREVARARLEDKDVIVYVGAVWCEPCKHFHDAAEAGKLDAAFPKLRVLVFDLDRDRDGLEKAGYVSKMIPLFALPKADGNSSGKHMAGSIKGEASVGEMTPRLQKLLAQRDER